MVDEIQHALVGPVQILEREHQRTLVGQLLEECRQAPNASSRSGPSSTSAPTPTSGPRWRSSHSGLSIEATAVRSFSSAEAGE